MKISLAFIVEEKVCFIYFLFHFFIGRSFSSHGEQPL